MWNNTNIMLVILSFWTYIKQWRCILNFLGVSLYHYPENLWPYLWDFQGSLRKEKDCTSQSSQGIHWQGISWHSHISWKNKIIIMNYYENFRKFLLQLFHRKEKWFFFLKSTYILLQMYVDCRLCSRSFPSRRQMSRHFQEVHGDLLECSVCKYTLPVTRKYLMEQHITRRHEGKPLTWTVRKRETFRNPGAYQPDFLEYRPRRITSRRSPRKSPRRPHVNQKPTDFNSPLSARILEGHLLRLPHWGLHPFPQPHGGWHVWH